MICFAKIKLGFESFWFSSRQRKWFFLFLQIWLVGVTQTVYSQTLSYVHYDIDDGLAGSTVYQMCQDQQGFMWFSTETGVSRFDGRQFVNYTVQDGLPDNDVLVMYCDLQNRIWFGPFKNALAYYHEGKIHNEDNDALLKNLQLKGFVRNIIEDKEGNLFFHDYPTVHLLKNEKNARIESFLDTISFRECFSIGRDDKQNLLLNLYQYSDTHTGLYRWEQNSFYKIRNGLYYAPSKTKYQLLSDKFHIEWVLGKDHIVSVYSHTTKKKKLIKVPSNVTSYSVISSDSVFINTRDGAFCYQFSTNTLSEPFLKGKKIGQVFKDDEKNLWFSTLGEGVYRLTASETRSYTFNAIYSNETSVYALEKDGPTLHIGLEMDYLTTFDEQKKKISSIRLYSPKNNPYKIEHKISFIKKVNADEIVYGANYEFFKVNSKTRAISRIYSTAKAFAIKNDKEWLLGEYNRLQLLNTENLKTKKILLEKRVTALYYRNDSTFIGTLEGLYLLQNDTSVQYLGSLHPSLKRRISAIVPSADGALWIATYDSGILRWQANANTFTSFATRQGLVSNICRTLFIDQNVVWVGTDKGINRISSKNEIDLYTTSDGLVSNSVNAIWANDSVLYVGTTKGLTIIKPHTLTQHSKSRIAFLNASTGNKVFPVRSKYVFNYPFTKNIKFAFAGISFKAGKKMTYRYLLDGFENQWHLTQQNQIEYQSLPAGEYRLTIVAVNQVGQQSLPLQISFEVVPPFWQTLWFYALEVCIGVCAIGCLVGWRLKHIKRQAYEKQQLHEQIVELEQRALKSQMNPHFIFNCLNSIQKYILEKDTLQANRYLHLFSKLIRQTLDISSQISIPIQEEINYLNNYLSLEQMRFAGSFHFRIHADPQSNNLRIPGMILQPFVENSIRHGIRYKKDNDGLITVEMKIVSKELLCVIEDNGVGRKQAENYKSLQHIEYQSRGMALTTERIEAINRSHADKPEKIRIEILDLADEMKESTGTRVCISFPLSIIASFR